MSGIVDYILKTNLFNFAIFAGIILYLFFKLDVIGELNKAKNSVKIVVDTSEDAKNVAGQKLSTLEDKLSHLQEEIEKIIVKSTENANLVGNQIISDANSTAESIKDNSKKMVENRIALLKNDIMQRASIAFVEVAKNHIMRELETNKELHYKLINESLEALSTLEAKGEG